MAGERWWAVRWRSETGNTLVLFPAAILVVFGLGAMALDSATIYLGQRRLADLAAATASDAAGGLWLETFYDLHQPTRLATDVGRQRSDIILEQMGQDRGFEQVTCDVQVDGLVATASCQGDVRPILAPFWPGMERRLHLKADATAHLSPR